MATIVVIDDNQELRGVVKEAMSIAGYPVRDWGNPRAAADFLASSDIAVALVIVDGWMPQMTGPEVATEIRKLRPEVPVLLLSGHGASMFPDFFKDPGHHYMAKPFVITDLIARVRAIV